MRAFHRKFTGPLMVAGMLIGVITLQSSSLSAMSQGMPKKTLTRKEIQAHQKIVGNDPIRNYKKIVKPGTPNANGIGNVIAKPKGPWQQVCFASGLCIDVATTEGPIETFGGMGCHKINRMVYVIREIAAQVRHTHGKSRLMDLTLVRLADAGFNVTGGLVALENCYLDENCVLPDEYQKFTGKNGVVRKFRSEVARYQKRRDRLQRFPEIQNIVDYQISEINSIIDSTSVRYSALKQEWQLEIKANLKAQNGRELCRASGQTRCRISR